MDEADAIQPIRIDADLWSHRDLLERIVGRWFHIIEEVQGVEIGWQVNLDAKQDNADAALTALNKHLKELSWIAILQDGSPYDLVILPDPPQGEGFSNGQITSIWFVFTLFLTLAGAAWLQLQNSELKLTDSSLLTDAFCWFALPISLVMFIGSESRRRIALRNGVDLGHHIPLAVPFIMTPGAPIWPFGVIGFSSQRRLDLIAFPDRKSLAITTLIAPLTMVFSGFIFTIIGYWMTSNISPNFENIPILVDPALLPEFVLSFILTSEEIALRSVWLHPLGLAGITLTAMGWILLLPLPGFPGDRLLSALLNPGEMEAGGTQTWLFVGVLAAGIYVILNGGYWPWLVLIALGVWRRFSPESSAPPFVLNETVNFGEGTKNRFGIVMIALLLLGFPGLIPVGELQDWDSGLDTSEWPTEVVFAPGSNETLDLNLKTIGVMKMDIEFQFRVIGNVDSSTAVIWPEQCDADLRIDLTVCEFGSVNAIGDQTFQFTYKMSPLANVSTPFALQLLWLEDMDLHLHQINFSSSSTPLPAERYWNWDGDTNTPRYCINITLDSELSGNLTIAPSSNHAFSFDDVSRIVLPAGDGQTNVCITGIFGTHQFAQRGIAIALKAILDDGSIHSWPIHFNVEDYREQPGGEWPANMSRWSQTPHSVEVDYIQWVEDIDADTICPLSRVNISIPTDENGNWTLNLSEIQEVKLPENRTNGTLILPDHGRILFCSEKQAAWSAILVPSNGSLSSPSSVEWWRTPWTNYDNDPVNVRIETVDHDMNSDWNLTDFTLQPGESTLDFDASIVADPDVLRIIWFEPTSEEWVLNLVSHCINPDGCSSGDS